MLVRKKPPLRIEIRARIGSVTFLIMVYADLELLRIAAQLTKIRRIHTISPLWVNDYNVHLL